MHKLIEFAAYIEKGMIMTSNASTMNRFQDFLDRFDQLPRGVKIAAMVFGFIVFWPIGLAILAYLIWSNQMGCCGNGKKRSRHGFGGGWSRPWRDHGYSSGNMAFDEYREATLKQLEEDQREFTVFIDRLRRAKDQREFDEFMADRMRRKQAENGTSNHPDDDLADK